MNAARVRSAYRKSESQAEIHPVKLIHLMYERVLVHLELAEQGLLAKDIKLRGENLSKAIAIITELNVAIKDDDNSEVAGFLRGLYSSILMELPKVGVSHDVEIIRQSKRYVRKLKDIWESTAMKEAGFGQGADGEGVKANADLLKAQATMGSGEDVKQNYEVRGRFKPVKAAPDRVVSGMSFSI